MFLSNHNTGFFHHEYLLKENMVISDFLHWNIHQGKVASETNTFGCVCPGILS